MSALSLIDLSMRSTKMADKPKNWIKKAVADGKGAFRKKAERAGISTRAFAAKEEDAPGKLGKEARLAKTLMGMSHGEHRRRTLYDRKKGK